MKSLNGRLKRLEVAAQPTWEDVRLDIIELMRQGKIDPADVRAAYPDDCEEMIKAASHEQ